jgi:hypothetical protein
MTVRVTSPDGMLSRRRRRPGVGSGLKSPSEARLPSRRPSMPSALSEKSDRRPKGRQSGWLMDGQPDLQQLRRLHDTDGHSLVLPRGRGDRPPGVASSARGHPCHAQRRRKLSEAWRAKRRFLRAQRWPRRPPQASGDVTRVTPSRGQTQPHRSFAQRNPRWFVPLETSPLPRLPVM